mmetsp:Transcript_20862/g.58552  ORF Transcript_20862/g.58552 Transcript_20862/m.58552 type:complete len:354 (+) Transcript_20862:463-1524(+)
MQSPSIWMCRASTEIPCASIVFGISLMMARRAASIPRTFSTSITWFELVLFGTMPGVLITCRRPVPSTRMLYRVAAPPPSSLLITARFVLLMPCTTAPGSALFNAWREKNSMCFSLPRPSLPPPCCGQIWSFSRLFPATLMSSSVSLMPARFLESSNACLMSWGVSSSCSFAILATSIFTERWQPWFGSYTSLMYKQMSLSVVLSMRPLTMRARSSLYSSFSAHEMIGVRIVFAALMISLIRGTPRVTFMLETPEKWNVFRVIWVAGSAIDCAETAPTASPGIRKACAYFFAHWLMKVSRCHSVGQEPASASARHSALGWPAARTAATESAVSPGASRSCLRFSATVPARPLM